MKKITLTILLTAMVTTLAFNQNLSQTVRGTILDADSKMPLIGANIIIVGTKPLIGTATNLNGRFRLENVPIGRINLQLSYLGYESKYISDIIVNSGKEVVLDLTMQESVVKLNEFVVVANKNKGEATNEMSLISSHSVSLEETGRYTGGMSDPSRVVSNFAGVACTPDGSSDIIVRGNSPKYMQWRLDGIEITSPYHFDDQNASFGALTALNNDLLATSDFYSGAFSPEYGDVLSSVFDVKLRTGNNEKFEAAAGLGIMGTDITVEGPFKKGYAGSYLVNYRYSAISLIKKLGLVDVAGVLDYQDATFKVVLPTKKAGTFSFFGLGGVNGFSMRNMKASDLDTPGKIKSADISRDYDKSAYLANLGMNHTLTINNNSFIKTSLSFSENGFNDDVFEMKIIKIHNSTGEFLNDSVGERTASFRSRIANSAYRGAITYNNKFNAKNKIQIGTKYTLSVYDYNQSMFNATAAALINVTDFRKNVSSVNNFISWKYSLNEKITIISGVHNMNVLLNNKSTLEPRVAINWRINSTNSVHAGYGNHSQMEKIQNYFTRIVQPDGSVTEPNKNLGLLKAHHYVIGYEKHFTEQLVAKAEVYYQHLYNLPVENNDTSYYATINEGIDYRYVALVNKGTGKNYGLEITIERFFNKNYYFLINASLFESKYKSLEGVWRNTQYNGNYLGNILCGKEFKNFGKKQNQTIALNAKIFFGGGKKYIPLLRDALGN
ncbi:MAG: TonB-dependent receptor, partial [Bacteroidetes bacterium]|nr:TonB-dependent receptor [Bacteroidota bacterium]